jgi:drug/metabolite transporter (DMT)-like permease
MPNGDAELRTLSAPGRWPRLLPFLAVTVLAFGIALLPPHVDPLALTAAAALLIVLLAAVLLLPWQRLPVLLEALPALGYFGVVILLRGLGLSTLDGERLDEELAGVASAAFPATTGRDWLVPGGRRRIAWSTATLADGDGAART